MSTKGENDVMNDSDYTVDETLEKVEVDVRYMVPGSMLVGTSFDKRGNKIKEPNEPFTKEDIEKLLKKGITELYYIPEGSKGSLKDRLPKLYEEKSKSFQDKQWALIELIRITYEQIKNKKPIDINLLRIRLSNLLLELTSTGKFIIQLLKTHRKNAHFGDERIFTHSVNVATLSMITAIHLRLRENAILDVSLAALLHDIGIANIDPSIIVSGDNLSEEELKQVKMHPVYTYNILKNIPKMEKNVLIMCLQHHEYLDASGYPKKLRDKAIFPLSHIISVSEMYDSLVTNKPYSKGVSTSRAILYILMKAGKCFHKKIANSFIKSVCERMKVPNIFPEESRVILNTHEIGVVKRQSVQTLRPQIEIVKDANHKLLKRPLDIDLSTDGKREIIRVLKLPSGNESIPQADLILKHFF